MTPAWTLQTLREREHDLRALAERRRVTRGRTARPAAELADVRSFEAPAPRDPCREPALDAPAAT